MVEIADLLRWMTSHLKHPQYQQNGKASAAF